MTATPGPGQDGPAQTKAGDGPAGPGPMTMVTGPGPMRVRMGPGGGPGGPGGPGPADGPGQPKVAPGTRAADTSGAPGIMQLANSFIDSRALLTGVELGLFTALSAGPASEQEIRVLLGLHGRGLRDWLELLAELGLLEHEDGRYRNAKGAASFLVEDAQYYLGEHLSRSCGKLYPAWGRLADALRTGEQQSDSNFQRALADPELLAQFVTSMDALTSQFAPDLVAAYDGWGSHQSLLDVGGCRGALAGHILQHYPKLTGTVFDLPQLAPLFEENVAGLGLDGQLTFHSGNFFTDPLPAADIVLLGHVLHDWAADQRKLLVSKAAQAVNPGGALLVYDRMEDGSAAQPRNHRASLNMLLMTETGGEYPLEELRGCAGQAGLGPVEHRQLGRFDTLVIAHKPG